MTIVVRTAVRGRYHASIEGNSNVWYVDTLFNTGVGGLVADHYPNVMAQINVEKEGGQFHMSINGHPETLVSGTSKLATLGQLICSFGLALGIQVRDETCKQ